MLNQACMTAPTLVFTNCTKPFLLETDASKDRFGAVLSQKQVDGQYHPVPYGSRALMPHRKNYHSTKLKFLVLRWAVTEHFKEYLPYQSFMVQTGNNLLMYVMSTPNPHAMSHWWVGALTQFNFKLEYQKEHDNMVVNILSQVTTQLDSETVKSTLDGFTLGTVHHANALDPAMVEGDQCLEQEVWVTASLPLVEMPVTNWTEAQRERTQCWTLHWTGWRHRSRKIWRCFWLNAPPAKKVNWSYRINRISQFTREPCTYAQCPRTKLKTSCSFKFPRCTVSLHWMGATKMQTIKGAITHYPCCENTSGGQE